MNEKKVPVMLLGLIGVVAILGLALMFTNGFNATGGYFFGVKSFGGAIQGSADPYARSFAGRAAELADYSFSCSDLCRRFELKSNALETQTKTYPYNKELKAEFEKAKSIESNYKDYTEGIKGFEWRKRQTMQCYAFSELADIAGVANALPKDDIAFCCKR